MLVATPANSKDLKDRGFVALASDIHVGGPTWHEITIQACDGRFNARKIWETTRLVQELERAGLLAEHRIGLGIGVGIEPLPFYLTTRGIRSIGTDLYGYGWPSAPLEMLWSPRRYAPYAYEHDLLTVMQMDGMKLMMPNDSVDFVYSISSVEHFGGLPGVLAHVAEARRVLKPGGILAFSTELCITGEPHVDWCFTNDQLLLAVRHSGMEVVNPASDPGPDLTDAPATLQMPSWTISPEEWGKLSIRYGPMVYTSAVLVLREPGTSHSIPWPGQR